MINNLPRERNLIAFGILLQLEPERGEERSNNEPHLHQCQKLTRSQSINLRYHLQSAFRHRS